MSRCRLCTANDRDALIDELAAEMWEMRYDHTIDPPWERAGDYWRTTMTDFARTTLAVLERDHR